jgi:hypothetical protein
MLAIKAVVELLFSVLTFLAALTDSRQLPCNGTATVEVPSSARSFARNQYKIQAGGTPRSPAAGLSSPEGKSLAGGCLYKTRG